MAGLYRRADIARRLLEKFGDANLRDDGLSRGRVADQLLGAAARGGDPEILRMALARVDLPDGGLHGGARILHQIVVMGDHVRPEERVTFARVALEAGARMDLRDDLLKSTALGWDCRWGREELVRLFLQRGADPVEKDAESWATPLAWAERRAITRSSRP